MISFFFSAVLLVSSHLHTIPRAVRSVPAPGSATDEGQEAGGARDGCRDPSRHAQGFGRASL